MEEIRNLEISKLSKSNFLNDDFYIKGQFTFEKQPIVAGDYVSDFGNLSTRNFENFGTVWNRRTSPNDTLLRKWSFVCNKGQYQAACEYGGSIYISDNFGSDWKSLNLFGDWACVGISEDGMTIAASEDTGELLFSIDGGLTFSQPTDYFMTSTWTVLAVSGTKLVVGGINGSNACNIYYWFDLTNPVSANLGIIGTYSLCFSSDSSKIYAAEYKNEGSIYEFIPSPYSYQKIEPSKAKWVSVTEVGGILIAINENDNQNICVLSNSWTYLTIPGYPQSASICDDSVFVTTWEGPCYTFSLNGSSIFQVPEFPKVYSKDSNGFSIEIVNDQDNEGYYCASSFGNFLTVVQSYGPLYISQNSGESFEYSSAFFDNAKLSLNTLGMQALGSISKTSGNIMAGNVLYVTNDSGLTWNFSKSLTDSSKMICSCSLNQYQVLGGYGYILFSNNYGKNFKIVKNDYFLYISVNLTSDGKILAMTNSGDLYLYENLNWRQLCSNSGFFITSVLDGNNIYLIKYDGSSIVYISNDFGETFPTQISISGIINCAQCKNGNFICSFGKSIRKYTDLVNYTETTLSEDIVKFVITDDGTYVVIFDKSVMFSVDFQNWCYSNFKNNDFILSEGSFCDIFFSENNVFVLDIFGRIYRSTDGGGEFSDDIYSNHFTLQRSYDNSMSMSSSGQYIASVTYNSSIQMSCNFGKTWFYPDDIFAANFSSCAVSMTGKYIVATSFHNGYNDSAIYISSDYGQTFQKVQGIKTDVIFVSCAISADGKIISVLEDSGKHYQSKDFGKTFSVIKLQGSLRRVILSYNGKFCIITTNEGTVYINSKIISANTTFAAMSFNARFISLCCSVSIESEKQSQTKIMTSDDYGQTFSETQVFNEYQPYNIAMTANGQYQIASTYGGVYVSSDYGGHFKLIRSNEIISTILSICCNSEGTIVKMMDSASNIYECRAYEQRDQIMNYSVSPIISEDYSIDGTYDVYQFTTECSLISLPKIRTLYPVTTRTITIVNVTESDSEIKIVCNSEDKIFYTGQSLSEVSIKTAYTNLQFMSNGSDTWFVLN